MQTSANIHEAFRSLLAARQRSLLALIGVVIGVGSVIAMVSIGNITRNEALRQFREMGTDILIVRKGYTGDEHAALLSLDDARALPAQCPAVRTAAPYVTLYGQYDLGAEEFNGPILGVTGVFPDTHRLKLKAGRFMRNGADYDRCIASVRN